MNEYKNSDNVEKIHSAIEWKDEKLLYNIKIEEIANITSENYGGSAADWMAIIKSVNTEKKFKKGEIIKMPYIEVCKL